jgi:transposase
MVTKRKSRKSRKNDPAVLGKPRGVIQDRVRAVGPERFGVVAVDCAKARSKWMLCDFYGKVLLPPTNLEHNRMALELAPLQLREACAQFGLLDHIVAVEMTGTYHRPVQRAFAKSGSETRLVHPFASSHYRIAADGDVKTDDHDLHAIFRAAVNGFGLLEPRWDDRSLRLQLLVRHRRDLVAKRAKLQSQIRQQLERCLPGYAALFPDDDLWTSPVAMFVARRAVDAPALVRAGIPGVTSWLREAKVRFFSRTVEKIAAWAANAAPADPQAPLLTRIWQTLEDDRQEKTRQIGRIEREIAAELVQTPYLLLLSHPGINVISAADLAGEMGPMEYYAHDRAVTGRAGLFPSRYQSDEVDRSGGLSRRRNARLRSAWLRMADNLIKCNEYYRGKSHYWTSCGVDPRDIRCRVANRVARTVFQMVSGRKLYQHPSRLNRSYIMEKLMVFHEEHHTPPHEIVRDLEHAAVQIPAADRAQQAEPLVVRQAKAFRSRRAGPQQIGRLLVAVLARLGVSQLQSSGEVASPVADDSDDSP